MLHFHDDWLCSYDKHLNVNAVAMLKIQFPCFCRILVYVTMTFKHNIVGLFIIKHLLLPDPDDNMMIIDY